MAVLKPTVSKVREPDDGSQMNGRIYNPPRFLKFGNLSGKSKVSKNDMAVTDRGNGQHGPYKNS